LDQNRITEIESKFNGKKIIVVGDLMLDGYFWGDVNRMSPEAPVPVVEVDNEFFRFGGAANVALNILKLGGIPLPVGVIGNDSDGKIFLELLSDSGIDSTGVFTDEQRPTTAKTRVIAGKQHVVRIDKESKENISQGTESEIINCLKRSIPESDAIILQDYNKGVLTEKIISSSIQTAHNHNKIISVDPKFINFKVYQNVTIFKPNKKESEAILGMRIITDRDISNAGKELLKIIKSKYVLLTLGEKGIALFEHGKNEIRIPTKARKVSDVSGAGDTVIATITHALTAGAEIEEAAYIANYAAGIVCEEVGIMPIYKDKLFETLTRVNR